MPETVALDSSVLWSGTKRDFLLSVAYARQYMPKWSTDTLGEVGYNYGKELTKTGNSEAEATRRADYLIATMRRQFPHAEVTGYQQQVGNYGLPDPNDEHVAAAAEQAGIKTIVTDNVKDFPSDKLLPGTQIVTGRDFAWKLAREDPDQALRAVEQRAARSGRDGPKMTVADVLKDMRERQGWPEAADVIERRAVEVGAVQPPSTPPGTGPSRGPQRQSAQREPHLRRDHTETRSGRSETTQDRARSQHRTDRPR